MNLGGDLQLAVGAARLTMSPWAPSREEAQRTLHAALDAGVRLLDTADCYSDGRTTAGANEALVADALASWSGDADDVLVATKGGRWRPGDGSWRPDARPSSLRSACEASLRALRVERIGLYHLHAVDPAVPLEESMATLVELRDEGKVAALGVSNVSASELARAVAVAGDALVSLQNSLSADDLDDLDLAADCGPDGLAFLAWAPLAGLRPDDDPPDDDPRAAFAAVSAGLGLTPRQVALGWLRSLGRHVVPIIGPCTPAEVEESVAAPLGLPAEALRALPSPHRR